MKKTEAQELLDLVRGARERQECRTSFKAFVKGAWIYLKTGTELTWNWHLDAICDFLQAQASGEIRRGVINIRARSLKSTIGSVCLHPWIWLSKPETRFLTGGYASDLAVKDCWNARQLISTPWYEALKNEPWLFTDDMNLKAFHANTLGGRRISTQVGAGTGQGAAHVIIDDPLSIDQSYSEAAVEAANRWFFETMLSRLDDPKRAVVTLIQHRLRPDDTSGRCKEMGFTVLELPLEYDPKRQCSVPEIDFTDPRTEEGELLCPEWWGLTEVEAEKMERPGLYQAICNQNPQKREITPIQSAWIRRYTSNPPIDQLKVVQSIDLSFKGQDPTAAAKGKRGRSKTGIIVLGFQKGQCWILDRFHEHVDWLGQKAAIRTMHEKWPSTVTTYIEDEANGSAMCAELGLEIPGIVPVHPGRRGGKWQRLTAISSFIRSGSIMWPTQEIAPWADDMIDNIVGFPSRPYDEDPDVLSQAISEEWLSGSDHESPANRALKLLSIDWSVD